MKTIVIHHSADFDGIFCREIARKFLPEAELIGWDYGQPKIPYDKDAQIYILDLSPECLEGVLPDEVYPNIIWIDHHKSAIEKFPIQAAGYRIDGVAACRLAWQFFYLREGLSAESKPPLPSHQEFVDRIVVEPYAVQLAGEYDIWDKRNPEAEVFQLGLRSVDNLNWNHLISFSGMNYIEILLENGKLLQRYVNQRDAEIVKALGFVIGFEGLKFLALNSATKGSIQFTAKDTPETGHDALLKFNWTGKLWDISLYHAKHRTDLDLSKIAVKHGGGGHRGACGFRTEKLPF
jgi:oligoribonuclease NrnB/cAMP/cGMP phosphodiesterase (DHH superfamily)